MYILYDKYETQIIKLNDTTQNIVLKNATKK